PVIERPDDPAPAVDLQISRRPDDRRSNVAGEYRIVGGVFAHQARDILRMDDVTFRTTLRQRVESFPGFLVVDQGIIEMAGVRLLLDRRQNGLQRMLNG